MDVPVLTDKFAVERFENREDATSARTISSLARPALPTESHAYTGASINIGSPGFMIALIA